MTPDEAFALALDEAEYEDFDSLKAAAEILRRTIEAKEAEIASRLAAYCRRQEA